MGPKKPSKESASKKESVSKRHKIAHMILQSLRVFNTKIQSSVRKEIAHF
jgi:hypothetical protein